MKRGEGEETRRDMRKEVDHNATPCQHLTELIMVVS